MKIIRRLSQNRRDFRADFQCEGCGNVDHDISGYDDRFFHDEVIPNKIKCTKCGKTRAELGIEGEYTETKYPEGFQV